MPPKRKSESQIDESRKKHKSIVEQFVRRKDVYNIIRDFIQTVDVVQLICQWYVDPFEVTGIKFSRRLRTSTVWLEEDRLCVSYLSNIENQYKVSRLSSDGSVIITEGDDTLIKRVPENGHSCSIWERVPVGAIVDMSNRITRPTLTYYRE